MGTSLAVRLQKSCVPVVADSWYVAGAIKANVE
jgi:hypothetical protein